MLIIKAHHLKKSFKGPSGEIALLEDVDFALKVGDSVSIQGPSGSGKSTLLNLLAGLNRPNSGSVFWEDISIFEQSAHRLTKLRLGFIGFIFQKHYLIDELNVLENVLLALKIKGRVKRADREAGRELLAAVGLADRLKHSPRQLSRGECQRVAFVRALIVKPKVILADEPTGSLDPQTGDQVMQKLLELTQTLTTALVLVTHNKAHAKMMAQNYQLTFGKLIS